MTQSLEYKMPEYDNGPGFDDDEDDMAFDTEDREPTYNNYGGGYDQVPADARVD